MKKYTYEEVALKYNLREKTPLFIEYMRTRWFDLEELFCESGYADDWAIKFANNEEYQASDNAGKELLVFLRKKYGI